MQGEASQKQTISLEDSLFHTQLELVLLYSIFRLEQDNTDCQF